MVCRKMLATAGTAALLTLATPFAASAHGPGYGGGNPYGWYQGGHMGPGMMQGCPMGYGHGMGGHGMMGPGMMGQGMMQGYGPQGQEMGRGMQGSGPMGPGMMGPGMMGPGMMGQGPRGGMMQQAAPDLSVEDVTGMLERRLAWQGNPHVKLGKVEEKDDDTIVAEIVTQDGSLVDRLAVDRHNGWTRPVR